MHTETKIIVIPTLVETQLVPAIEKSGLEPATAEGLLTTFTPLFAKAHEICATARTIVVTDVSQAAEMKQARALRLALKAVRVEAEKTRKTLKEDSLRRGKAIDGVYSLLEYAVAPVEGQLLDVEQFAERKEAERKAALKQERAEKLAAYGVDSTFFALAEMPEDQFAGLLENSRVVHEAKLAAERKAAEDARLAAEKAEAERIAREKAEAEERERIRQENERLKREAIEREEAAKIERERVAKERAEAEAKARAEREKLEAAAAEERRKAAEAARVAAESARKEREAIEAKARAEREARERAEAETRKIREAEEAKRAAEEAARKKAASAPDREKIKALAATMRAIAVPAMTTDEGKAIAAEINDQVAKFAAWLEKKSQSL